MSCCFSSLIVVTSLVGCSLPKHQLFHSRNSQQCAVHLYCICHTDIMEYYHRRKPHRATVLCLFAQICSSMGLGLPAVFVSGFGSCEKGFNSRIGQYCSRPLRFLPVAIASVLPLRVNLESISLIPANSLSFVAMFDIIF